MESEQDDVLRHQKPPSLGTRLGLPLEPVSQVDVVLAACTHSAGLGCRTWGAPCPALPPKEVKRKKRRRGRRGFFEAAPVPLGTDLLLAP